ncbi:MAG: GNAT family N-acetyltransferase [bacterium]
MHTFDTTVRPAEASELDALATVWYDAWQDGHAGLLPAALQRVRTRESFRDRLHVAIDEIRVVGPVGSPKGFYMLEDDELHQLFVAADARGRGSAAALISDAEARLRERGVATAWLACAIGNDRAARFYEKCGWRRTGIVVNRTDTSAGVFEFDVWKYEKTLRHE